MSQLNVDDIYNNGGDGGVNLPAGVTVSGISTVASVDLVLQGSASGITSAYWDASDSSFKFNDNCRLKLGTGTDLQLVHDGSNSFIHDNGTGSLILKGTAAKFQNQSGTTVFQTDTSGVSTATTRLDVGSTIQAEAASGIVTATSFIPTEGQLANRNVIINGAMTVAQRGTSETSVGNQNGYGQWPDRFREFLNTTAKAGVWTISQDSEAPDGFGKSTKWDCTTAGTLAADSYGGYEQYIEGFNVQRFAKGTSGAKPGVLSFYVKTNKTGTYAVEIRDNDNTRMVGGTYTVGDTNWNRYTVPIPADTTGAWGDDNGSSLWIRWWLVAGSNFTSGTARTAWAAGVTDNVLAVGQTVDLSDSTSNEWYITGVQLEVGEVATPFEHRSYGDELARCQRYYQQWKRGYLAGNSVGTSDINIGVPLTVPLRAAPTIAALDMHRSGNKTVTVTIVSVEYSDVNSIILEVRVGNWTGSDQVVDETAYVVIPSGTMKISAEL